MAQETILRKIPEDMQPWECNVNGVKYVYPAGTEQNVPAEVAAIIDAYWENQEVDYPETGISFNDLRDRPFYEESAVLFDQRVELADGQTVLPYNLPISDGDLVVVTIDGFKYEVNAFVDVTGAEVYVTSGSEENPDFIVITGTQADSQNTIIVVPNKASATVKIEKSVIHTIDPKFLPGGEMVVNITAVATMETESTPQFVADKTFAEIAEAVTKAKFCRAVADVGGELMFGFMNYAIPGERYVFKFDEFVIAILENEISFTPLS